MFVFFFIFIEVCPKMGRILLLYAQIYFHFGVITGLWTGQYDRIMRWWGSNLGQGLLQS